MTIDLLLFRDVSVSEDQLDLTDSLEEAKFYTRCERWGYISESKAVFVLRDPEWITPGKLLKGLWIRVQLPDESIIWIGNIDTVEFSPGENSENLVTINALGMEAQLKHILLNYDLTLDTFLTSQLQIVTQPPSFRQHPTYDAFRLDHTPLPARLARAGFTQVTSVGTVVLDIVGDTWPATITAYDALYEFAKMERGRLFANNVGQIKAITLNQFAQLQTPAAIDFDDEIIRRSRLVNGEGIINQVEVSFIPREIVTDETFWELLTPMRIRRNQARDPRLLRLALRDALGRSLGLLSYELQDFEFTAEEDGSGADYTATTAVQVREQRATSLQLAIYAPADEIWLQPGAKVVGSAYVRSEPVVIRERDEYSITQFGLSTERHDLVLVSDFDMARNFALYTLGLRSTPRTEFTEITFDALEAAAYVQYEIGDVIRIAEGRYGHDSGYVIAGVHHRVTNANTHHEVTFTLEPVDARAFWLLGVDLLDVSTRLG